MRALLLFALLLWGCSKASDQDLASIGEARSLGAEWALVNEQAAKGQLTQTYADTMRSELRQQLRSTATSLKHRDTRYGEEISAMLQQPDDAPAEALRIHIRALKQIEDRLESA
jgi:polyhydroxyalkanoate synthesis regulator phasin